MKYINTNEKTFNKSVKALVIETFWKNIKVIKRHVAGAGYVHFIKDSKDIILGKVYKYESNMKLTIN